MATRGHSVDFYFLVTFNIISVLLHRPDQVFWLWTRCSDPVWYQKRPLHRQRIPRGEQVAGHAWWVHQKICAVSRVWQPWNWSGKCLKSSVTQAWEMKYEVPIIFLLHFVFDFHIKIYILNWKRFTDWSMMLVRTNRVLFVYFTACQSQETNHWHFL